MSPQSKKEYLKAVFLRYKNASRKGKTQILDEFCATCGYHRKYAIRLLRKFKRFIKPKHRKKGRKPVYDKEVMLKPLKCIWRASNLPCSKRPQGNPTIVAAGYIKSFGDLPSEVTNALLKISPSTIDRILLPARIHYKKRGRSTTKH